jgi:predicted enzyme related to lactoylglutathione lyase
LHGRFAFRVSSTGLEAEPPGGKRDARSGTEKAMINGGHIMIFDRDPAAMRDFLRDVLALPAVDSGNGRLLMQVPPTEIGVHETEGDGGYGFYFQCDDIESTVAAIEERGGVCGPRADQGWGVVCEIEGPGGRKLALYEPRHPMAHGG